MEFLSDACAGAFIWFEWWEYCGISFCIYLEFWVKKEAVPKVMSVALIELVEMTATLNVVVSINSTTVVQTYWTAIFLFKSQFIELYKCSAFYLEQNSDYLFYVLLDEIHFQIFKFFCDRNFVDVRI